MLAYLAAKISKPALYMAVIAIILALAGLSFWRGMAAIDGMVTSAAVTARSERDAVWKDQIAESNAVAERARADQAIKAAALEFAAAQAEARATAALSELEKKNAALPGADSCGLSAERGRLLDDLR